MNNPFNHTNNTDQINDDTITVLKAYVNTKNFFFIFKDPRNLKACYSFYPNETALFLDPCRYYNNTSLRRMEKMCRIPIDQWDKFIKRLSILSASIQALIGYTITTSSELIFPLPNQDTVIRMMRQVLNDKFILIYEIKNDNILVRRKRQLTYDPQTHEFINQYFMEIKNNMNHWLKLEQQ